LAVFCLINSANCVSRDPLLARGKVDTAALRRVKDDHPVNYAVPNFGVD